VIETRPAIETARLVLRPFRDADRDAFAALNGDPRVSDWLGGPIDRAASDAAIERIGRHFAEHGFGCWAAERKADGRLIGMIGLKRMEPELPPAPAVEACWRLSPDAWGQGFATEGAQAAVAWGLAHLAGDDIIAITAAGNLRSRAVMQRIGMVEQPQRAFDHPKLADDHPLRRHVVYAAAATSKPV
jgi:RimJ/RimL family protein N-acetyltransferase